MKKFEELHADIANDGVTKIFKVLDEDGLTIESWEKDEQGVWHDYTERDQLKETVEKEQAELARLDNIERIKLLKKRTVKEHVIFNKPIN